ncbi:MAG: cytidine deaminase [Alphaproteobacteria bacterium]
MLMTSASDENELEHWRNQFGRCQLSNAKMRPQPKLADVLVKLPGILALIIRMRLKAGGWLGPLCITGEEINEIVAVTKMDKRQIMVLLLDVASALAQMPGEGNHIGAVLEGETDSLYIGAPITWQGKGAKFSAHGIQTAILSAWQFGEKRLRSMVVETPPCACCRQFVRETWNWNTLKIVHAPDGPESWAKGTVVDLPLSPTGLKLDDVKSRLMGEPQRGITLSKMEVSDMVNLAVESASLCYAPYSKNFAGIAVKTKKGMIFQGRYAECATSIAGILAIEAALINMFLCGVPYSDISEILLVETRGSVTQFSVTQKLATAMGSIPFRFMMAT